MLSVIHKNYYVKTTLYLIRKNFYVFTQMFILAKNLYQSFAKVYSQEKSQYSSYRNLIPMKRGKFFNNS